ncbi:RHS repeat-associated core domain-containing protein [Streptomyces bauhiniae]|uniref:RHS repeat-associated core domain-containing protein n=1 Tax=Streptomyces bauhiniae TaxID=2340725 RepID=UPI00365D9FED
MTTTVAQPFSYAGAYLDTSGLYTMGARQYDRTTNRFTQVDPNGKETNAYLYTAGDPVNRTDPTGLWSLFRALGAGLKVQPEEQTLDCRPTVAARPVWVRMPPLQLVVEGCKFSFDTDCRSS